MEENNYAFSYTNYQEIDNDSNPTGVFVTGPKHVTKQAMYAFCWPGCLTVMYDASKIGLIQIEDIKKNNDYAMWLGVHHPILLARIRYFARFKKPLHLKNPKTLNEKILFLSLKTDTSLWTKCADKYEVRDYVKDCGLEDILIPLVGVWEHATDIDFDKLPDEFVLKATHGSGDIKVVTDKNKLDIPKIVAEFEEDLKHQYGALESGHHYMRIHPRMIAEELIHNDQETAKISSSIIDYKIWCFNGKVHWLWACANRDEHTTEVMTYDTEWNAHPEYSIFENDYRHGEILPKPKNLGRRLKWQRSWQNRSRVFEWTYTILTAKSILAN